MNINESLWDIFHSKRGQPLVQILSYGKNFARGRSRRAA